MGRFFIRTMSKPLSPCKGCENRIVGCHSQCDKYMHFLALLDGYKKTLYGALKAEDDIISVEIKRFKGVKHK